MRRLLYGITVSACISVRELQEFAKGVFSVGEPAAIQGEIMRTRALVLSSFLLICLLVISLPAAAQQNPPDAPSAQGTSRDKGAQTAPPPEKVRNVESEIKRESRRWRLGVRAGAAFNPELFLFGVQSQIGPIFHPRVQFRPNAEFAFGEVTDLIALNLEGVYRFSANYQERNWTPYIGAGPALIFIHQNFQLGREIDFGNFDYETGFNVLVGVQNRRGTFFEMKTSLYSGPAPKLRLIVGHTF